MLVNRRTEGRRTGLGRITHAVVACVVLCFAHGAVPVAWAVQRASEPKPEKPIFEWIFSLVMVGLVCVVAFKNPKRSHKS